MSYGYKFYKNESYFLKHDSKGYLHGEVKPAVIYLSGEKRWYRHGILHREDGPAVENSQGIKGKNYFYLNGYIFEKKEFIKAQSYKTINIKGMLYLKDGRRFRVHE